MEIFLCFLTERSWFVMYNYYHVSCKGGLFIMIILLLQTNGILSSPTQRIKNLQILYNGCVAVAAVAVVVGFVQHITLFTTVARVRRLFVLSQSAFIRQQSTSNQP
jgi:hypothetical protein